MVEFRLILSRRLAGGLNEMVGPRNCKKVSQAQQRLENPLCEDVEFCVATLEAQKPRQQNEGQGPSKASLFKSTGVPVTPWCTTRTRSLTG